MGKQFGKIGKGLSSLIFLLLNRLIAVFKKVDPKKVLFLSDQRSEIGGNFVPVWDWLEGKGYRRVTFFKADRRDISGPAAFLRMVYHWTTAGTILLEDYYRYTSFCRVRRGQQICQLWHACGAFKKFAFSRAEGPEDIHIHTGYRKYAKAICSAESIRACYADAFDLDLEKVQATGIPRTDLFFDEDKKKGVCEKLYRRYPVLKEKKVILFAPTYRGGRVEDAGYDTSQLDFGKLRETLAEDYVFIIKWHPAMYNNIVHSGAGALPDADDPFFLDLSSYRDINELLLVTDILVTDYSSVIFDYYLTGRPIVFFLSDHGEYEDGRGIYFPMETYEYGAVAETTEELIRAVQQGNCFSEKREAFGQRFMSACDGHSTEKCCRWIFEGERP